ncbi:MAG: hypothetical protein LBI33_04035, partial [Propionibacteriaceae bacterium]|nr:hypothetical protein [Propionibacteriaceae bacterium]
MGRRYGDTELFSLVPDLGADTPSVPAPDPESSAKPPRRPRTRLIVVVVAAVIAVAGLSWYGAGRWGNSATPAATASPAATSPATPTPAGPRSYSPVTDPTGRRQELPVDLTGDLLTPQNVSLVGVWSGVAVFDVTYSLSSSWSSANDILRGVDTRTGETLWTYDALPDWSLFQFLYGGAAQESGGYLALTLPKAGAASPLAQSSLPDTAYCIDGTYLILLDLVTGEVVAQSFFDANCTVTDGRAVSRTEYIVAFEGGIIVVQRGQGAYAPAAQTYLTAYRVPDLDHALWETSPSDLAGSEAWFAAPVAGWVAGWTTPYVRLVDGREANPAFPRPSPLTSVRAAGDLAIETVRSDAAEGLVNPWIDSLAAWTDPGASAPVWTYAPEPGWVIESATASGGGLIFAQGAGALVVLEGRYEDYVLVEARFTALRGADGSKLWSQPYGFGDQDLGPMITFAADTVFADDTDQPGLYAGYLVVKGLNYLPVAVAGGTGHEVLLFFESGEVRAVDAATGERVGAVAFPGYTTVD